MAIIHDAESAPSSNWIVQRTNKFLRKFGIQIAKVRKPPVPECLIRRRRLLAAHNINLILDVGANTGQYGKLTREIIGYKGRIESFEPMAKEFSELQMASQADDTWSVHHYALGDTNGSSEINISGNSVSSSLLEMLPSVLDACTVEAANTGVESIEIKTLDSIFESMRTPDDQVFLKMDTQGYERTVLDGSLQSLSNIVGIQLETSLIPFYEGETMFNEMLEYVTSLGFKLMSVEEALTDPDSGRQLQVDCIFFREDAMAA